MKIFAVTVGKNEVERYLRPMLIHSLSFVDHHFFYDDGSTDGTPELAEDLGCTVVRRPDYVPSFAENEGICRGMAWETFGALMNPEHGDLVLIIDCDETLVSDYGVDRLNLRNQIEHIAPYGQAFNIDFAEIWGFFEGVPFVRVDRLWGTIHAPRLFKYQSGGFYHPGQYGVPAVPGYVQAAQHAPSPGLHMLHYGYARVEDRRAKYLRYTGGHGHLDEHVESIFAADLQQVPWTGPFVMGMMRPWNRLG